MALLPWNRWKSADAEDAREIDVHLDLEAEDQVEGGVPLDRAGLAARRKFGSIALAKEELRGMRTGAFVERLWQDVRYALKLLQKSPGFTTVAVFTLALAVAANTAIFSIVEAVMLRPLAYKDSEQLVSIVRVIPNGRGIGDAIAAVHFVEWRRSSRSFDALSMVGGGEFSLTGSGEPENVTGAVVSASVFSVLGVTMQLGRPFLPEEEEHRDHVVVLTDGLWRRRFGGDPTAIGRSAVVGGAPYTIVGVLPPTFRFPAISQLNSVGRSDILIPIAPASFELDPRSPVQNYSAIGRLKPGVTVQGATADLNSLQVELAKLSLDGHVAQLLVVPLRDFVARNYRAGLILIWASVATVLLISCVNIANLLLAREARRRREMAVRTALGASRGRIVRQMIIESLVLSSISGALGFAAAYGLVRVIVGFAPADVPRIEEVNVDWRVLVFTLTAVVLDGLVFGVLPAWRASKVNPQEAMSFDSRTSTGSRDSVRLRALLVSGEVALCALSLLVGGLLLRSFSRVLDVQRGFEVDDIQTVSIGLPPTRYQGPKRAEFTRNALERIRNIRGVQSAGVSTILPLAGGTGPGLTVTVPGWTAEKPTVWLRVVDADYFPTMGIPLKNGRLFRVEDTSRQVAILSRLMARRLWPNESALGKQFHMGPSTTSLFEIAFEVIGIVGDAHAESLTSDLAETVYLPYWQDLGFTQRTWSFVMKTNNPNETAREARAVLRDLDPQLPIPAFRTMDDIMSGSVSQRRFQMNVVLLFAAVGLLLASVGIYGVVAYSVAQRTHEMGIRVALGAKAGAIQRLVVRQGLLPLIPGLVIGIAGSLGAERLIGSLLFGVSAKDPATIVGVAALLTVVALAASYVPARRATRINPVTALRYE